LTKTLGTKEWAVKNVNFSVGCENNCKYCYAKAMAYRFGRIKNREEWEYMRNKPEMAKKRFKKVEGWIMSPSSHDITEKNVDLAIDVFRNILIAGNKLLIVTKPRFECIKKICVSLDPYRKQILFRFTIGSNNTLTLRYWETNASGFEERLASLRFAHDRKLFLCCNRLKKYPFTWFWKKHKDQFPLEKTVFISSIAPYESKQRRLRLIELRKKNTYIRYHKSNGFYYAYPLRDLKDRTEIIKILNKHNFNEVRGSGCVLCPVLLLFNMAKEDLNVTLKLNVTICKTLGILNFVRP